MSDNASASARFPRLGNKGVEVGRFLADINPNDITRDPNLADKSERTNPGKLSETECVIVMCICNYSDLTQANQFSTTPHTT